MKVTPSSTSVAAAGFYRKPWPRPAGQVTGIDLADEVLTVAKLHGLDSGVKVDYRLESAEDHADQHTGHYDIVTCMEMLEHVPQPAAIIEAAAKAVKPGGWVFFSHPEPQLQILPIGDFRGRTAVGSGTERHPYT